MVGKRATGDGRGLNCCAAEAALAGVAADLRGTMAWCGTGRIACGDPAGRCAVPDGEAQL